MPGLFKRIVDKMDFTRRGRGAAADYSELSFHNIKFHFPNVYEPVQDSYEKKVQESFHKIFQSPEFPPRSTLVSEETEEIDGVDCMLSHLEVERYGKMERRLELLGCNYKIVENTGGATSLYKAISQAIHGDEKLTKEIQKEVFDEITVQNFQFYRADLVRSYIEVIPKLVQAVQPKKIINEYRKYTKKPNGPASTMELHAAAKRYKFRFGVIFVWKNVELLVVNCYDPELVNYPVKFYFLVTGKNRKYWHYELLLPLGNFIEPLDGKHKLTLKAAIVVPDINKSLPVTFIPDIPDHMYKMVFAIDDQEFLYKDTMAHNLFQILSEMYFGDMEHAEAIRDILDERRLALDYVLRPKVVRDHKILVPGALKSHTTHAGLQDFRRRAGDLTYLKLAAAEFAFSTIAIGVDTYGNFSVTKIQHFDQKIVDVVGKMPEVPWQYFFVRNAGSATNWHLLHKITHVETVLKDISKNSDMGNPSKIQEMYEQTIPLLVNTQENYSKSRMELKESHSKSNNSRVFTSGEKIKLQIDQHAAYLRSRSSKAMGLKMPTLPSDIEIVPATVEDVVKRRLKQWELIQTKPSLDSFEEEYEDEEQEINISEVKPKSSKSIAKITGLPQKHATAEPNIKIKVRESFESRKTKSLKRTPVSSSSVIELFGDQFTSNTLSNQVKSILADYKKETRDTMTNIKNRVEEQMMMQGFESDQDTNPSSSLKKVSRVQNRSDHSNDSPTVEEIHRNEKDNSESSANPFVTIHTDTKPKKRMSLKLRTSRKVAPMPAPMEERGHLPENMVAKDNSDTSASLNPFDKVVRSVNTSVEKKKFKWFGKTRVHPLDILNFTPEEKNVPTDLEMTELKPPPILGNFRKTQLKTTKKIYPNEKKVNGTDSEGH